ncbi:Ig-like domain-containing protein [Prevotella sp. E13-17]|uniref:Ig-like domain-containing protein n=1 Tax=Prevotella sp. E13-17 TaxID=2913616 RepID=UPI001EDBCE2E|nr:Ig-like domain-containing protein [Prevotella sp. E13-17]UKK50998.1 Ig-like domain-containing protein [Prevotella sp. E13-17]
MKKILFPLLVVLGLFLSCVEHEDFPSPLEGLHIENQTFSSAGVQKTINVDNVLTDVMATVIDTKTKYPANWLDVKINQKAIALTLMENITVSDRTACVTLHVKSEEINDEEQPVVFYVTQKKNSMFDGLDVDEVVMGFEQGDTTLTFKNTLKNTKTEIYDLDGQKVDWVKAMIDGKNLTIAVSQYASKDDRAALVRLVPNSDQYVSDSLLSKASILVRQTHNPVLDSLTIKPVKSLAAGGRYVIHTDRQLTGVRAQVIDDATKERASWCTATVAGDSVAVTTTIYNLKKDRTATVMLFYPNHGETIDTTTITLPFVVEQGHNRIFDGVRYDDRTIVWNQTADTLKLSHELQNILCQVVDTLTKKAPTWLQATVEGNKVLFKSVALTSNTNRTVKVTLYMKGKDNTLTEQTVQTSFYLTQNHDNIFDGVMYKDRVVSWDEKADTLKLTRELTGISCQLTDVDTKQTPTWLQATVKGKQVFFTVKENMSKADRTATVTLYLPNGNTIDEKTVKTSFAFKQSGNNIFNGHRFENQTMSWNETVRALKQTVDLSLLHTKLVDNDTKRAPTWLQVTLDAEHQELILKPQQLTSVDNRSATVTLFVPNNGNTIDENTEQVSFVVNQEHYNIFDDVQFNNRAVNWDEKYDTLKLSRELTGIRCQLVDNDTHQTPGWLQATVNGKHVEFVAQTNYSKYQRSASVTLYLPNGNTIDAKTVHTGFTFTQKGNNLLDSLKVANLGLEWNTSSHAITTKVDLTSVRYKLVDEDTQQTPTWLNVILSGNKIELKPSKLTTKHDRSAMVTLYVSSSTITESTPQKSFRVTQHHDNIFDNLTIKDRELDYDQTSDVLTLTRELEDIHCQIIDNETQMTARWLSAVVKDNQVFFTAQTNTALAKRSATVTLYLPNGNTIDENSVKTSFKVEQNFQVKLVPSVKKVEVSYKQQTKEFNIVSNVKYQIKSPSWVDCVMTPIDETTEKITLSFKENFNNEANADTLRFLVAGEEMAKVAVKQRTNPHITINFSDHRKVISCGKNGGEFNLPVKTLTPGYHVSKTTKNGSWFSVDQTIKDGYDLYYNLVRIPVFRGADFERIDSIILYNDEVRIAFPVKQHKYVYVEQESLELELGGSVSLEAKAFNDANIQWSSSNAKVASVSEQGLVTALARGSVHINAGIPDFTKDGITYTNYFDYCEVKVYDATDKVNVKRGSGEYEKTDGYVTSQCPIVITNNYHSTINITSVVLVDKDGNELPVALSGGNGYLYKNQQVSVSLTSRLNGVYKPSVKLTFSVGGKTYTKTVEY